MLINSRSVLYRKKEALACETVYTATGAREFNASINGVQVLTNFDIVATAGGPNIAVVEQFPAAANSSGQIVVYMSAGAVDGPTISGIEIVTNFQLDSGGGNVGTWTGDKYYNGGGTSNSTATINTSAVSNPAPQSVYQTQRYGYITYTIPNLTANATYYVRLHFAETTWTSAGQREFNASINGVQVLTNFDIIANAGAPNTAITETFSTTANSSGQIVIYMSAGAVDGPTLSGFEILSSANSATYFYLSGQATYNNAGLSGVTMTLSGSSSGVTTTDSDGNYSFSVASGGTYVVTASLANYSFSPPSRQFANVSSSGTQSFIGSFITGGSLTPSSPAKEYIYANGQVVAIDHVH